MGERGKVRKRGGEGKREREGEREAGITHNLGVE